MLTRIGFLLVLIFREPKLEQMPLYRKGRGHRFNRGASFETRSSSAAQDEEGRSQVRTFLMVRGRCRRRFERRKWFSQPYFTSGA